MRANAIERSVRCRHRLHAALRSARAVDQKAAHLDDCGIRCTEMFQRAVDDGTRALRHRRILGADARDTGERFRLLFVAVDIVVVAAVRHWDEGTGYPHRVRDHAIAPVVQLLIGDRTVVAIANADDVAFTVILRHPHPHGTGFTGHRGDHGVERIEPLIHAQ